MDADQTTGNESSRRSPHRFWVRLGVGLLIFAGALVGLSVWLTEPLEPEDIAVLAELGRTESVAEAGASADGERPTVVGVVWPTDRLGGDEAKRTLLEVLVDVKGRLDRVTGYTATFRKQERFGSTLRPEETLAIKVRHRPFAFYGKFLGAKAGKEVVYAEGHHDNKVIATGGGFSRLLVPRLALDPNSPLALVDSRHPVTDAGLSNLVNRLVNFRKLDLTDPKASTVLDRWTDETGRLWLRSVHTHPRKNPSRPFAHVEVLYDPATLFPLRINNTDWNEAGDGLGEPAERYAYDDLQLDVPLTALDFDPANPNYAFHRF